MTCTDGKPIERIQDRYDGAYEQLIRIPKGNNPLISVQIDGQQLAHERFQDLLKDGENRVGKIEPPKDQPSDEGCGCVVVGKDRGHKWHWLWSGLVLIALGRRRFRRG